MQKETPEAKRRYEICMNCEDKIKIGNEWVCSQCGCFLRAKTRSPKEKCLNDKW